MRGKGRFRRRIGGYVGESRRGGGRDEGKGVGEEVRRRNV